MGNEREAQPSEMELSLEDWRAIIEVCTSIRLKYDEDNQLIEGAAQFMHLERATNLISICSTYEGLSFYELDTNKRVLNSNEIKFSHCIYLNDSREVKDVRWLMYNYKDGKDEVLKLIEERYNKLKDSEEFWTQKQEYPDNSNITVKEVTYSNRFSPYEDKFPLNKATRKRIMKKILDINARALEHLS